MGEPGSPPRVSGLTITPLTLVARNEGYEMAESLQVVDVTALTRPVRFASRETLYAASAGTLYLSGASDAVSSVLAKPLPHFLRRNRKRSTCRSDGCPFCCCMASATTRAGHTNSNDDLPMTGSFHDRSTTTRLVGGSMTARTSLLNTSGNSQVDQRRQLFTSSPTQSVGSCCAPRSIAIQKFRTTSPPESPLVAHRGTPWAYGPGSVLPLVGHLVRELRPGSDTLRQIDEETVSGSTRWVSMYSVSDEIVPMYYGQLDHPELEVQQIEYRGLGHYGLMYHPLP